MQRLHYGQFIFNLVFGMERPSNLAHLNVMVATVRKQGHEEGLD